MFILIPLLLSVVVFQEPALDQVGGHGQSSYEYVGCHVVDENPKDAQRFLKRFAPKHNVVMDPKGEVAALYELPGMPTSFIIDGAGKVVYRHLGFKEKDIDIIRQHLMTLLEVSADEN